MKLHRATALAVAVPTWLLALMWLWPRAVRAAALSAEVEGYDWISLGYAAGLGLLGAGMALLYALAADSWVVLMPVVLRSGRNALVSPMVGAGTYLVLKGLAAINWFTPPLEWRFLLIVIAGGCGIAVVQWAKSLASAGAPKVRDGLVDLLLSWLKKWQPGARGQDDQGEKP